MKYFTLMVVMLLLSNIASGSSGLINNWKKPESVTQAQLELDNRRNTLARSWVQSLVKSAEKNKDQEASCENCKDLTVDEKYWYNGIGKHIEHGSMRSLRRIAAVLYAFEILGKNSSEEYEYWKTQQDNKKLPDNNTFKIVLDHWSKSVTKYGSVGTPDKATAGAKNKVKNYLIDKFVITDNEPEEIIPDFEPEKGNYDMFQKEVISLLFRFKNHPDFSEDAVLNLVKKVFYPVHIGKDCCGRMTVKQYIFTNPETENHLLMIYGSQYLINDFIREKIEKGIDGENKEEIKAKYKKLLTFRTKRLERTYDVQNKRSEKLHKFLMQAAGRFLHKGVFETNARVYQVLTFHAMINLASYAKDERIRIGFQNALDYMATKFAFQSFNGARYVPHRRNHEKVKHLNLYQSDGLIVTMGALSGALGYRYDEGHNPDGVAFWALLSNYRLPPVIHDYMLHKHDGYWAIMQAKFKEVDYSIDHRPHYLGAGRWSDKGLMEPALELYFATPDYMNSSGGQYSRFKVDQDTDGVFGSGAFEIDIEEISGTKHGVYTYDFLTIPQTLIVPGFDFNWDETDSSDKEKENEKLTLLKKELLTMQGENKWWHSYRGTSNYKGFAYGYSRKKPSSENSWVQQVPPHWPAPYSEGRKNVWSKGQADFQFYDFSNTTNPKFPINNYLILAKVSKVDHLSKYNSDDSIFMSDINLRKMSYQNYNRGFWEVVPKKRFGNIKKLKDWVLRNNPTRHFNNDVVYGGEEQSGAQRQNIANYLYKMTTGELLELDPTIGKSLDAERERQIHGLSSLYPKSAIVSINGKRPNWIKSSKNGEVRRHMPLMEVHSIDPVSHKNKDLIVISKGGKLTITNNYFFRKRELVIDSSNWNRPKRTLYIGGARPIEISGKFNFNAPFSIDQNSYTH